MTQDERFLKAMNITPEAIPEPKRRVQSKADPLIPEEIDVERCGEFITMSIGDFQTMLSANWSLAEGARQLQEDLASERGTRRALFAAARQWRNAFLLLACGICAILLAQLVLWVNA